MGYRFAAPPSWPPPPSPDWVPPPGWRPDASWGPAPEEWTFWVDDGSPAAAAGESVAGGPPAEATSPGRPVLTFVLLSLGVLFTVSTAFALTDKESILENPPDSDAVSVGALWGTVAVVLAAILVAALARPRSRGWRVAILLLVVPLLGSAALGTLRLRELSASGFLREARLARSSAQAADAALRGQLAAAASAACRGTAVPGAAVVTGSPRVVMVDEQGRLFGWDVVTDRAWAPRSLADLQVVACVGPETSSVETCRYTGGTSYDLTSFQRTVRVLEAATATDPDDLSAALGYGSITGADSDCYDVLMGGHVPADAAGDPVEGEQVADYVAEVLAGR